MTNEANPRRDESSVDRELEDYASVGPKRGIEGVWMPKEKHEQLTADLTLKTEQLEQSRDTAARLREENERLRCQEATRDKDFAYAMVTTKLHILYPVLKMVEEGMRDLDGVEGEQVARAISSAANTAQMFLYRKNREAQDTTLARPKDSPTLPESSAEAKPAHPVDDSEESIESEPNWDGSPRLNPGGRNNAERSRPVDDSERSAKAAGEEHA